MPAHWNGANDTDLARSRVEWVKYAVCEAAARAAGVADLAAQIEARR